ncbi:hypothetical protein GTR02_21250, partial [Kineococcus sp. R8]|nr:hypothetical protein [Kineococcus siccus]
GGRVDDGRELLLRPGELALLGQAVGEGVAQLQQHLDVERGAAVGESELPLHAARGDGPPPPRTWAARHPEAAARLTAGRALVTALADEHDLPVENLLQPDALRRLAWSPPAEVSAETVAAALRASRARAWQVALVAAPLAEAFVEATAAAAGAGEGAGEVAVDGTVAAAGGTVSPGASADTESATAATGETKITPQG